MITNDTNIYLVNLGIGTILILFLFSNMLNAKTIVTVKGKKGNWELLLNKNPFYVQGVGCGLHKGKDGEDYLKLAKELGANTVRTWGTDQGTQEYLDTAEKYGLKVMAGIWLNYASADGAFSYITDTGYMKTKKQEIVDYINKFKNHPAILMWNIGNEAIHFTKSEKERIALSQYLEEVVKLVHKLDPAHPVIYASAYDTAIPYIKKYVPSLDILGMNVYGDINSADSRMQKENLNIPYIITEYGPIGWWDCPKDKNGKAIEPTDNVKSVWYRNHTRALKRLKGYNLGGVVFHLGETTQETLTWWNINYKKYKALAYWTIYKFYTGKQPANYPPKIKNFSVGADSSASSIKPGKIIKVTTEVIDYENDSLDYSYLLSGADEGVLKYYVNEEIPVKVISENIENSGMVARLKIPDALSSGMYRIYVFVRDDHGNIATANKSVQIK